MSAPGRSEGRSARLRREWTVLQGSYNLRKARGERDERRGCAREAEALQCAGCHGAAVVHGWAAWICLGRAAVVHAPAHRPSSVTDMSAWSGVFELTPAPAAAGSIATDRLT